jgi:hypothetical protein
VKYWRAWSSFWGQFLLFFEKIYSLLAKIYAFEVPKINEILKYLLIKNIFLLSQFEN